MRQTKCLLIHKLISFKLILPYCLTRDKNSFYPIHYAAKGGFAAAAQLLIDKNAKINVLDRSDVSYIIHLVE